MSQIINDWETRTSNLANIQLQLVVGPAYPRVILEILTRHISIKSSISSNTSGTDNE